MLTKTRARTRTTSFKQTTEPTLAEVVKRLAALEHLFFTFQATHFNGDDEGEYRPEFVKEMLKAAKRKPNRTFKDAASFLKELEEGV